MFLKIFLKTEAGHVLKMFLNFGQIWASRSYKLGSYKKKNVYFNMLDSSEVQKWVIVIKFTRCNTQWRFLPFIAAVCSSMLQLQHHDDVTSLKVHLLDRASKISPVWKVSLLSASN